LHYAGAAILSLSMLPYTPSAVAEALHAVLDRAAAAHDCATLAIPGGRSPGPVLTALASQCDPFLRDRLHLLWLDERAVAVGDAERNDAPTLAAWSAGGPLPAHLHAMPAERADLYAAAAAYAALLTHLTAGRGLDACLIGIGEDGHVASLFPGHAGLRELDPVFPVFDSPKPPARRLTMSLGVIRSASFRAVLALGAAKGAVVRRARAGQDPHLPCSLLPADTLWFLDDAAQEAL
jgi:6-phosphogluconolactonase